jgi:hypothetical protein
MDSEMTNWIITALIGLGLVACGDNETHPPGNRPYTGQPPAPLECVPNLDGRIDSAEIGAAIDTPISYLVSPAGVERPLDVAGTPTGGGRLRWQLSTDYADDQVARLIPQKISGKWYEASFPAEAFVTPFDAAGSVESVVTQDPQALWLLGLASRDPDPPEGKTLLLYQAPVALLQFPLAPGSEFVSTGVIENGTLRGLPYAGKDIYAVKADALGELVLPALTFTEVHRVRTHATVQPAVGASTSRRQVSFFFECFAEVARATSRPDEPEENFTTASELRRIGF